MRCHKPVHSPYLYISSSHLYQSRPPHTRFVLSLSKLFLFRINRKKKLSPNSTVYRFQIFFLRLSKGCSFIRRKIKRFSCFVFVGRGWNISNKLPPHQGGQVHGCKKRRKPKVRERRLLILSLSIFSCNHLLLPPSLPTTEKLESN